MDTTTVYWGWTHAKKLEVQKNVYVQTHIPTHVDFLYIYNTYI